MKSQRPLPGLFSSLFVGHLVGSLGFAAGITSSVLPEFVNSEALAVTAEFWNMSFDAPHLPFLATINILFTIPLIISTAVYAAIFMVPLTILTCPVAILAAKYLTTSRSQTTLLGALVGLVAGLPAAWILYGSRSTPKFFDPGWMTGAFMAGALFAQPIWTWCIKPRIMPVLVGASRLRSRPKLLSMMVIWLVLPATYLFALVLFG